MICHVVNVMIWEGTIWQEETSQELRKLPYTSYQKVKFECLFCLSRLSCLSYPWPPWPFWPPWPMITMTLTTIMTLRKLEVERKEVGGCLVSYNLQLAYSRKLEVIWPDRPAPALPRWSLWMMNGELMNEWMTNVGIELLRHLNNIWQMTTYTILSINLSWNFWPHHRGKGQEVTKTFVIQSLGQCRENQVWRRLARGMEIKILMGLTTESLRGTPWLCARILTLGRA